MSDASDPADPLDLPAMEALMRRVQAFDPKAGRVGTVVVLVVRKDRVEFSAVGCACPRCLRDAALMMHEQIRAREALPTATKH